GPVPLHRVPLGLLADGVDPGRLPVNRHPIDDPRRALLGLHQLPLPPKRHCGSSARDALVSPFLTSVTRSWSIHATVRGYQVASQPDRRNATSGANQPLAPLVDQQVGDERRLRRPHLAPGRSVLSLQGLEFLLPLLGREDGLQFLFPLLEGFLDNHGYSFLLR